MHIFNLSSGFSTQNINFQARKTYKKISYTNRFLKFKVQKSIGSKYKLWWKFVFEIYGDLMCPTTGLDLKLNKRRPYVGKSVTKLTQNYSQNSKNPSPLCALIVALEKCKPHFPAREWFSKPKHEKLLDKVVDRDGCWDGLVFGQRSEKHVKSDPALHKNSCELSLWLQDFQK